MLNYTSQEPIAYFCAEYGLDSNLPLYAGGLGVLAGDTIKAAADANIPFVGIGLLYRGERAIQAIDNDGMQVDVDMDYDPLDAGLEHVYQDDQPLFVRVHMTEVDVWARVWKKQLSDTVTLYLLDTDTDQNQSSERSITHGLYMGTEESQLKQQFILGIGGVKLLNILGLKPAVYHLNEGRPALLFWELARSFMDSHGCDYSQAVELAKKKVVYTNHTLVAAGNYSISFDLLKRYGQYYADKMGISIEQLLENGLEDAPDRFYTTRFSLNSSRKSSGVSALHTNLSAEQWPGYNWNNITNGVHMPTWQDSRIAGLYSNTSEISQDQKKTELWNIHLDNKNKLADFVREKTGFGYDPNRMVVTWARRLAGYKRLDDVFEDIERLRSILKNSDRPVQLLVAGKAHVLDNSGKLMLQKIIKFMAKELSGHAIFIPNYNLEIANYLAKGSDVWLNIPEFGKEACGTSGMKAISNGVVQCTVPDGWANEVEWYGKGWTLDSNNITEETYSKLENEIVPMYFDRDEQGIPRQWLDMMDASVQLAPSFSAARMIREYQEKLYSV